MRFGSAGARIAAASKKDTVLLLKVGRIPIVRRIVLTLQQTGVFPIVVVTGTEELKVTRQVAPPGVVFTKNKERENVSWPFCTGDFCAIWINFSKSLMMDVGQCM